MKGRHLALLAFLLAFAASAGSQTLADYQFSTGHDASMWYTLDSTRNLLVDGSEYYRRSFVEEIGFTFPFADTSFSQFSVTLAGVLRLGGSRALTSSGYQGSPFHPTNVSKNCPKIVFFGCTGYASDSAYVHHQVFGDAPSRVLVVEFAMQTYNTASRHSLFRYQVQLFENGDIQIVYPSQTPTLLPNTTRQQGIAFSATDLWTVDQNHVATHLTAGTPATIPSGCWPDTNRYYRFELSNGACAMPTGLVASSIDTSSVTLTWGNPSYAQEFAVEYGTSMFAPGTGAGTAIPVYDTTTVIGGLQPNTQYHFYVRTVCSEGDTSNVAYLSVRTLDKAPVSDFPYFCNFEDSVENQGWFLPEGNLSTRWFIDTAVNNTSEGSYALYISQDSGRTNTGGDQWIGAYAYRDVNLTAGDWTVSFDWRAVGEWSTLSGNATIYNHFLRAFLVPSSVNFTAQTPPSFPNSPHSSAVPNGWIDLNPASHVFVGQNGWANFLSTVTVPTAGCYHLTFYWETDGYPPDVDRPAAIDNISIEGLSCARPRELTASVDGSEMMLNWQPGGSETLWMVRYDGGEVYVQDTFYLVTDLELNTLYTFSVYAVCGAYDTSLATVGTFRSALGAPVSTYPYVCDFEDSAMCRHWVLLNEGQPNGWHTGTAANNTPQGQRALYVSNDGGTSNAYSGADPATSYAYRELVLDASTYSCSFDWRCQGDDDFHFFRAFILPVASIPEAGTFPDAANHYSSVPSGWIDLNPTAHYMSGQSSWTTLTQSFTIADSGLYALLLMWENDNYTTQNPPAAVDNIRIALQTCPTPENLSADAMPTAVDLTWDAGDDAQIWLVEYGDTALTTYTPSYTAQGLTPNTEYTFRVSKLCISGDTSLAATLTVRTECNAIAALPYTCDFENYANGTGSNDLFIPCWYRVRNYSTFSPQVSQDFTPGNKCLYWNLTAGLLDDVYVVLPELAENIEVTYTELRFKAMKVDYLGLFEDPVLVVGVMSDPLSTATFSPVDTIVVSNDTGYVDYSVPMLAYVGSDQYVAIRGTVFAPINSSAICLLDDVELHELQYCRKPMSVAAAAGPDTIALSWTPGGDETQWLLSFADTALTTSQPSYVARNLVPDTEYVFFISAVCGAGDTSDALVAHFRTQPSPHQPPHDPDTVECLVPTNVGFYQDTPWSNHAYEFHFFWSGNAPAYQVRIINTYYDIQVRVDSVVTDTTFFFDAEGDAGLWTFEVRSLCNDTVSSDWSEIVEFDTPLCVGFGSPSGRVGVKLYPNPTNGTATLLLNGIKGKTVVSVVDIAGRGVIARTIDCDGETPVSLPLEGLAVGTYFVRISAQGDNIVRKLVVKP